LTILVGPNGAGKTSVLHALNLRRDPRSDRFARKAPLAIGRTTPDDKKFLAAIVNSQGQCIKRGHQPQYDTREFGYSFLHLAINLDNATRQAKAARAGAVTPDGSDLVNTFATLARKLSNEVVDELSRMVPIISDVSAEPVTDGRLRLVFQDRWHPA
jgi:predicted ATPase